MQREAKKYGLKPAMNHAQLVNKLTEVWCYLNMPHSPPPVLPRPAANSKPPPPSAAQVQRAEEERARDEAITTALKKLPELYKQILLYKVRAASWKCSHLKNYRWWM